MRSTTYLSLALASLGTVALAALAGHTAGTTVALCLGLGCMGIAAYRQAQER